MKIIHLPIFPTLIGIPKCQHRPWYQFSSLATVTLCNRIHMSLPTSNSIVTLTLGLSQFQCPVVECFSCPVESFGVQRLTPTGRTFWPRFGNGWYFLCSPWTLQKVQRTLCSRRQLSRHYAGVVGFGLVLFLRISISRQTVGVQTALALRVRHCARP